MDIKHLRDTLHENLIAHAKRQCPQDELLELVNFFEAFNYSLIPAGKLFRPLICAATYHDFGAEPKYQKDIYHYCSFLEFHHTYSLVHDDLPSMDNDDFRRGRASTHKAYGEWMAILTGDALLGASYHLLSQVNHPQFRELFKFCTWALGPKGLILGQVYDLSGQINESLSTLLETHYLKTGRLIQCALVGGYILSSARPSFKVSKDLFKLGKALGVSFQLLDDLSELGQEELNQHELDINPWRKGPETLLNLLSNYLKEVDELVNTYEMSVLTMVLSEYYHKMKTLIERDFDHILKNLEHLEIKKKDLIPVIGLLNRFS